MSHRLTAFALAAAAALAPIAAHAQPGGYTAVPAAQPTRTNFIAGSTPFAWQKDAFISQRLGDERPGIMCELVAKQVGKLASFSAAGMPLAADKLAKCNARAK